MVKAVLLYIIFFLSEEQKQKNHNFHKNIKHFSISSIIFYINNNNNKKNVSWAPNRHSWMISEGSYDTEDWLLKSTS